MNFIISDICWMLYILFHYIFHGQIFFTTIRSNGRCNVFDVTLRLLQTMIVILQIHFVDLVIDLIIKFISFLRDLDLIKSCKTHYQKVYNKNLRTDNLQRWFEIKNYSKKSNFAEFLNDELCRLVAARNERTDSIAKHLTTSTITAPDLIQIAPQKAGGNGSINYHNNDSYDEEVEGRKKDKVESADIVGGAVNVIDTADLKQHAPSLDLNNNISSIKSTGVNSNSMKGCNGDSGGIVGRDELELSRKTTLQTLQNCNRQITPHQTHGTRTMSTRGIEMALDSTFGESGDQPENTLQITQIDSSFDSDATKVEPERAKDKYRPTKILSTHTTDESKQCATQAYFEHSDLYNAPAYHVELKIPQSSKIKGKKLQKHRILSSIGKEPTIIALDLSYFTNDRIGSINETPRNEISLVTYNNRLSNTTNKTNGTTGNNDIRSNDENNKDKHENKEETDEEKEGKTNGSHGNNANIGHNSGIDAATNTKIVFFVCFMYCIQIFLASVVVAFGVVLMFAVVCGLLVIMALSWCDMLLFYIRCRIITTRNGLFRCINIWS